MRRLRDNINTAGLWDGFYNAEFPKGVARLFGLRLQHATDAVRDYVGVLQAPVAFVDVGCGLGEFLRHLVVAVPGLELHGVDFSPVGVAHAQKLGGPIKYHLASAETLPFRDASMGGVWLGEILEHLDDPVAGLREAVRVTRSGGAVILSVPDGMRNDGPEHVTCIERPDLEGWGEQFGELLRLIRTSESGVSLLAAIRVT